MLVELILAFTLAAPAPFKRSTEPITYNQKDLVGTWKVKEGMRYST